MKKTILFTIIYLFTAINIFAQSYSGGSGTENDPYLISSKTDMETLATAVNGGNSYFGKYFLLTQDLIGVTTIIGNYNSTSKYFSGIFDGGGHIVEINIDIRNRNINSNSYAGVFGRTENATIKNLGVSGSAYISNTWDSPNSSYSSPYVGGICGYASNTTFINCFNNGEISSYANRSRSYSGGICANMYNSKMYNCYNTGHISSSGYLPSSGGVCGEISVANISNCYNIGNIYSNSVNTAISGGICGNMSSGNINNCLSINETVEAGYAGRIIGKVDSGIIGNCYALSSMFVNNSTITSGSSSDKNGEGENLYFLKSQNWIEENVFWDFNDIWYYSSENDFPLLRVEYQSKKETIISKIEPLDNIITYGDDAIILNAITNSSSPLIYLSSNNEVVEISGNTLTIKKTGTITITAIQECNDTFHKGGYKTNLTIHKKGITVKADTVSIIYGETPQFTCKYEGFVFDETESVLTKQPIFTCAGNSQSNVGSYPITASGAEAENYSFTYKTGLLNILKRDLKIIPDNISRGYGDNNPTLTLSYDGFVNGNTATNISRPTASTTATRYNDVGVYDITCFGGSATNYNFIYETGKLTINKAPLATTANNASRYYGSENPVFTASYSGFKNSETKSVLLTEPELKCTATKNSSVGNYPITVENATATNYEITPVPGTLTINKVSLTAKADNKYKYETQSNPPFTITYFGFVNEENESVIDVLPQAQCDATTQSSGGNYTISVVGGEDDNYEFNRQSGTLTIKTASQLPAAVISFDYTNPNLVTDMSTTLLMSVSNEEPIVAFTTDITFPSYVSVDLDKVEMTNRCDKNTHILNAVQVSTNPNKYIFMIYSPSNKLITGNNGELIKIPLVLDWNLINKVYSTHNVSTSSASSVFFLSELSKPEKTITNVTKPFYIHEMGDVNINGTITISDIVAEVDYTLGKNPKPFLFEAGDMNKNKAITILDLTQLVNVVLTHGSTSYAALRSTNSDYELSFSDLTLDYSKGEINGNLKLSMKNKLPVIALNWDLVLPDGILIDTENVEFSGSRATRNTHTIATNQFDDENRYRFIIYSTQNKAISGTDGELLSIPIKIDENSVSGTFFVEAIASNLIYVEDGEQKETTVSSVNGTLSITGTNQSNINNPSIYNLSVYPNPAKYDLYISSDQAIEKVEIFNQSGICILQDENFVEKLDVSNLPDGFYFARIFINGSPITKKIIIKK